MECDTLRDAKVLAAVTSSEWTIKEHSSVWRIDYSTFHWNILLFTSSTWTASNDFYPNFVDWTVFIICLGAGNSL